MSGAEQAVTPINDLVEKAGAFDRQAVTVRGEAVGDVMIRGDHGWVNISDGTNDIGVYATAAQLRAIRQVGRYHTTGDVVRVTGEFHRADPEHGGDLDLHAATLVVVQPGGPVAHPVPLGRVGLAGGALALALVLGLLLRISIRRSRAS
ncbi:MAG TPA: hypothetical protein VK464_07615 [Symbiobacteriaceae bacterium]|nr:hypothetical protein [Symbiobacteriaceae bacterium]